MSAHRRKNSESRGRALIAASREKHATKRAKGYADWMPHQKTRVILDQVDEIFREYRDYLPLTARQVFYRLVGRYGYPKDEKAYERLTNYLTRARRARLIAFHWLRDDGASVMDHCDHYEDEKSFYAVTRERAARFKLNKLSGQKVDIRVYCEAAGMMPQLHDALEEFSIPVFSCSGFDSLTAKWDLKEWCHDTLVYHGKTPVVLHLGDYDPSGESIFNDGLVEDIHAFLEVDAPDPFHSVEDQFPFQRVALTREQIDRRAREGRPLPSAPPKPTDSRSDKWVGQTYQLEALPPNELAQELRLAVLSWLDEDKLEERIEDEPEARRNVVGALPAPKGTGD